jgi:glycerophosphoryl diester phosphodiesterase
MARMMWLAAAALLIQWLAVASPALAQLPLYAAHRGGALLWPENSLLAFRNAIALGADFIEFDVHLSKDGEVIVIHDPTLDRTTTGRGPVRDRTLVELEAMRLRDRAGAATDEPIPTLEQVAALAAQSKRRMLLEIKLDEQGRRYPGIEERVLAILDRTHMASATVVMAFEPETWRRVRELRPEQSTGALYSTRTLRAMGATASRELGQAAAAGVRFIGLQQPLVDRDMIAAAAHAGIVLAVWTVNERDAIRRFIDQRVGVVITDRPDLAKELLGR